MTTATMEATSITQKRTGSNQWYDIGTNPFFANVPQHVEQIMDRLVQLGLNFSHKPKQRFRVAMPRQPAKDVAPRLRKTMPDQLLELCRIFGVGTLGLADLLGEPQQLVSAWMDGQSPGSDKMQRILDLIHVADALSSFHRPDFMAKRPLDKAGTTLLDLLRQRQDVRSTMDMLRARDEKEHLRRGKGLENLKPVRGFHETATAESTPLYNE